MYGKYIRRKIRHLTTVLKVSGNPIKIIKSLGRKLKNYLFFGNSKYNTKNLIAYPYQDTTKTVSGITFTDNYDGSISLNGTATANVYFNLSKARVKSGETYTVSCYNGTINNASNNLCYQLYAIDTDKCISTTGYLYNIRAPKTITATKDGEILFRLIVYSGTTLSKVTLKPQCVFGNINNETVWEKPTESIIYYPTPEIEVPNVSTDKSVINLISPEGTILHTEYKSDYKTVNGNSVDLADVSPDECRADIEITSESSTDEKTTSDASDLGSAKVEIFGKNLLDIPMEFSWTGTYSKSVNIPAGTYILSWSSRVKGGTASPVVRFTNNDVIKWFSAESNGSISVELTQRETQLYFYSNDYSASGSADITSSINSLMLSLSAGKYESYKSCKTYIASSNGKISQATIFHPNTTIFGYDEDSSLEVKYRPLNEIQTGRVICINNTYEDKLNIATTISSKNLVPYPNSSGTVSKSGITFTDNGDGSITINGTAAQIGKPVRYYVENGDSRLSNLKKTKYVFSGCPNGGSYDTYFMQITALKDGTEIGNARVTSSTAAVWDLSNLDFDNIDIKICVQPGVTVENLTFRPQLEEGTSATEYTQYISDLTSMTVSKRGKNFIPYPYEHTTKTQAGITFTDNGDGSITLNGTATEPSNFYVSLSLINNLDRTKTYVLSGGKDSSIFFVMDFFEGTTWKHLIDTKSGTQAVVNLSKVKVKYDRIYLTLQVLEGTVCDNVVIRPQLEVGTAATEYEMYKNISSYSSDTAVKIEDFSAVAPISTIIANNNVLIETQYGSNTNIKQGSIIRIDDVSPIEHEMEVKVSSKNMIDGTLWKTPTTSNGITVYYSEDENCFVLNGTATQTVYLANKIVGIKNNNVCILSHKYISGNVSIPSGSYAVFYLGKSDTIDGAIENYRATKNFSQSEEIVATTPSALTDKKYINKAWFYASAGVTFDNYKVQIQFEEGTAATEYTQYISDFSSVTVSKCGKNLIPYPYSISGTQTVNGVTYSVNSDGTITLNGTATDGTIILNIFNNTQNPLKLPTGNYTLSGIPAGNGASPTTFYLQIYYDGKWGAIDVGSGGKITASSTISVSRIALFVKPGVEFSNLTVKPQFEIGTAITEYEKYNKREYIPQFDGSVSNVESSSPTMTFMTDNKGSVVEAKYYSEIKTYEDNVVRLDKVSESGTILSTKIYSSNVLSLDEVNETVKNGLTYSLKNNVLSINGTATASLNLDFNMAALKDKIAYTHGIWCNKTSPKITFGINGIDVATLVLNGKVSISKTFVSNNINDFKYQIQIEKDTVFENCKYSLQIEKGNIAKGFAPYENNLNSAKLTVREKNILPWPFYNTGTVARNGITFTNNGDGTVTANGTATANADFYVSNGNKTIPWGVYRISGCPAGGGTSLYRINVTFGSSDTNVSSIYGNDFGEGLILTATKKYDTMLYLIRISAGCTVDNIVFKPQLELIGQETDYISNAPSTTTPLEVVSVGDKVGESYKIPIIVTGNVASTEIDIALSEPLRKIGESADSIDWKRQKVIRQVFKRQYTSSNTFTVSNGGFCFTDTTHTYSVNDMCTHLANNGALQNGTPVEDGTFSFSGNKIIFKPALVNTLEEFKEWLDNNEVCVYGSLSVPVEETVVLPEISTYIGDNIIDVQTKTEPSEVQIDYVKNK